MKRDEEEPPFLQALYNDVKKTCQSYKYFCHRSLLFLAKSHELSWSILPLLFHLHSLKNVSKIWNPSYCSPHFSSFLSVKWKLIAGVLANFVARFLNTNPSQFLEIYTRQLKTKNNLGKAGWPRPIEQTQIKNQLWLQSRFHCQRHGYYLPYALVSMLPGASGRLVQQQSSYSRCFAAPFWNGKLLQAWLSHLISPKGRVPRALPVGEWELAHRASSISCVLERVPRAMPVAIYKRL